MIEKKTRKSKKDFSPHRAADRAPRCQVPGCAEPGVYKAPVSRHNLHDYQWYCLDHIREHNAKWNFFDGMTEAEVEKFMREAITGERPTWTRESHLRNPYEKLQEALMDFLQGEVRKPVNAAPPLSAKFRKALATMEMEYPYSSAPLKKQYRKMVKQHHPDVNKGDKRSEEKFKEITASYHYLTEQLKRS